MKVYIENSSKDENELKGKSLFCKRLAKVLSSLGVYITDDREEFVDISLNVIRIKHKKSRIKLLRLDGVWHDTGKPYEKKNKSLSMSLHSADAVVYQSNFSKNMADKYLGVFKGPSRVIHNGADPKFFEKISPIQVPYKYVFLTFSKWRPHKRLKDILKSFIFANIPESCLLVAGNLKNAGLSSQECGWLKHPNIRYLGDLNQEQLAGYLKTACASIHLCWFDSCPNSVVEAIVSGTPVISNNTGGTPELVGPANGYVCNIDKPYDMNPVDLYHPPEINVNLIAEAMYSVVKQPKKVISKFVNIEFIAKQYLDFMNEILK